MNQIFAALCGAALAGGCSSVPIQKVESNSACDYALMERVEAQRMPTLTHRYWVNCPRVEPDGRKS